MIAPGIVSYEGSLSESDPKLLKVAVCNVDESEASAEVIDSVGTCLSPGRFVVADTTLNCSHPNAIVEDRVADCVAKRGETSGSSIASAVSPIARIADVDSVFKPLAIQVLNTKTLASTPSCLLSQNKSTIESESLDPNNYTILAIVAGINATKARVSDTYGTTSVADPRTELDSHANMCVLGKHSYIFESTGKTCNVSPFMDGLGVAKDVPIVDGAVAYDCPYTRETYILIVRNALHIPSMENNLIPPFIMRQGGVVVNDVPKFQCKDPSVEDHTISFDTCDLRIPMQLKGTFSYFHTRTPMPEELHDRDKVFITPDSSEWNPHCLSFERNERAMLDYEGELSDSKRRLNLPMEVDSDDGSDVFELASVNVDAWEKQVDANISSSYAASSESLPESYDLDNHFAEALNLRAEISKVQASVGSTNVSDNPCSLFDGPHVTTMSNLEESLSDIISPSQINEVMSRISAASADKPQGVKPSVLSKLWCITEKLAEGAVDQNTQFSRLSSDNTLSRQLSSNDRMLRYRRIESTFFTDTMFATPAAKSPRQNTCCQVFVSDKGFVAVYPMKSQEEFQTALHWFCKQVGVPSSLVADGHRSQTSSSVKRFCHQVGTTLRVLERGSPWANRAELYIGLLKEAVRKDMRESHSPMVLWDYAIERRARIHNAVPRPLFQNNGLSPHAATFGSQGDISSICNFGWYEWIYYRDKESSFPENKLKLGRVLGPIPNEGNEMAQAILTSKGTIIPRRSLRKLLVSELHSESEKRKRQLYDDIIRKKLGDSMTLPKKPLSTEYIPYSDGVEPDPLHLPSDDDPVDTDGTSVFEKPITDYWIHAEVSLPQGEKMRSAKVVGRSKDSDGNISGTYDDNPHLNTMTYDVEFPDGEVREYAANVIAENMYAQVDADGHMHTMLDSILDYSKDGNAVELDDMYVTTKSGNRRMRQTTNGWKLLIQWKDGSEQWIPLKLMKEYNPVEVAEFACARQIDKEPAFAWWVPYTLRKRDRVIAAVNSRVKKSSHKYGVEVPRTVAEAFALDEKNGNTFWRDATNREMENLKVAFDILPNGKDPPPTYRKASGHIIFDVRMTLERKARWVKDGHRTPEPDWCTFAGVVSRESIRIALTYASLNGLPVFGADIQNAYLQAPTTEKHYIICGPEFGLENEGKKAIIVRALYGGKSAGADYWRHVRKAMDEMGFTSCKADPEIWMRPGIKDDGSEYWQYVLLYTDDILCIMEHPEKFLREEMGTRFTLKEKSIGPPTQYLGNKVSNITLENGTSCWSFSSSQYVQSAVKNVEDYLDKTGEKLPTRAKSPWPSNYRPESDLSPELSSNKATYFQSLIGVLRWIVELGRADIAMETSALASMMASPRNGHLNAVFHMFAFLKIKHNGVMVFDPTEPDLDISQFPVEDWSASAYGECKEELPPNAPKSRGLGFTMRSFVDSDHAGDTITRRSRTGFIIFLNSAPIYWYSKKQGSVETSSFGSEFIAMKQCCEYVRGLRYKLRMMGIPVDLPSYIFGDNQSVLANTSHPHSKLRKKSSSIAFHFVREGVAKLEWCTTYLNTHLNPADLLTKSLPGGEKRSRFTAYLLHYLDT